MNPTPDTTISPAPANPTRSWVWFTIVCLIAYGVTRFLATQEGVPREAELMGGIFVLAAGLWVTAALPLFATSLLVVALQIILLANPGNWEGIGFESGESPSYRTIIHGAVDPILMLFFGGFLLAQAAVKEGVDKAMSAVLLRPFGSNPQFVLLGLMIVTSIFSMWMSNTASTAMMITLVAPIALQLDPGDRFRTALYLAVPFAANIGGMGTPIASPPNAVAAGFLQKEGIPVSFLQWILIATPLMIVLVLLVWQLLWRSYRPTTADLNIRLPRPRLSRTSFVVVAVFVITVLGWLTDSLHGLPASVVALFPAIVFTASGILNRDDLKRLEWNVLILIGGGISLGAGMQLTGLDDFVVDRLPISGAGVAWLALVMIAATIIISTFMSNTAAANLLLPIAISTTTELGDVADSATVRIALSIALAASMSMALPISTPPNAIAFGSGAFSVRDMARNGAIIGLVSAVMILLLTEPLLRLFGVLK